MRVVFLTGIWPPDVGGPATHGPDFAAFLRDRGHDVHVVTMGDSEPTERPVPVSSIGRGRPFVIRYPQVAAAGFRLARHADVVYATATFAAAAAAASSARRPLVAKLVSDPAYERAWRYGLFNGTLEEFQRERSPLLGALKRLRQLAGSLGVTRRVSFAGALPRDGVLRRLAGARAALLPSLWENLPHAAVEALSVGTPVVATTVGGVPEVVHDGVNGLLVPPGDAAALAAAMRRIAEDDSLRDRPAAAAKPSVEAIGREPTYTP